MEDLPRLVNDIRYDSFIIVGLRGKLQKASDYFLFSREKIKELILLSYPVFFKCQTRLLWSSFLTMSFFPREGKDLLKISFKRERKGLSVIGHVNGPNARISREPSSRQCLSQEREKTCYLRWLSEGYLRSVGIETIQ